MMNPLILSNQKLNRKDMEIEKLRSQSDLLRNELIHVKELMERMNKPNESLRDYEKLMRSLRSFRRTSKQRAKKCKIKRQTYMLLLW